MRNNIKKTDMRIDIEEFDKGVEVDDTTVEAMILKLKTTRMFTVLPTWMDTYYIPPQTPISSLSPVICLAKLVAFQKSGEKIKLHPAHQLEALAATENVSVNVKGVSYVNQETKEREEQKVVLGYLLPKENEILRLIAASTADILASETKYDRSGNLYSSAWDPKCGVPIVNCHRPRTMLDKIPAFKIASRSKSRDSLFSRFMDDDANKILTVRVHSMIGRGVPNFKPHKGLARKLLEYYEVNKLAKPENLDVLTLNVDNGPVKFTEDIRAAYQYFFASQAIRGGPNGKGVSHGYERFCMTRTMAGMLNLVADFKNMCEVFKCDTIVIYDTYFLTVDQIRTLVHNKISVCAPNSIYPPQVPGVPGMYGRCDPSVPNVEYYVPDYANIAPKLSNKVLSFGKYYDDAIGVITKKQRVFARMPMDSRLDKLVGVSLLPTCSADTMDVYLAVGVGITYELPKLIKRSTMAISCRNRFVVCRRPFCTMDIMAYFCNWNQTILLPRLRAPEGDKGAFDLVECKAGEDIPPVEIAVREELVLNTYVQESARPISEVLLLNDIIKDGRIDYVIMAYISHQINGNLDLLDDKGQTWCGNDDPILGLDESTFRRILFMIDPELVNNYTAAEIQIEKIQRLLTASKARVIQSQPQVESVTSPPLPAPPPEIVTRPVPVAVMTTDSFNMSAFDDE